MMESARALPPRGATVSSHGLLQCGTCHLLMRAGSLREACCPRCGVRVHERSRHSLQTTSALLIAALALYWPANTLPIMNTRAGLETRSDTIISGIFGLMETGSWVLALIVFVASVLVPLLKIGVLAYLVLTVHAQAGHRELRTRLYRLIELVGRWSMLDVFVVALLAALVQLGPAAEISAGPGAVAFGAVVWLTLWATQAFDPRLIWDAGDD